METAGFIEITEHEAGFTHLGGRLRLPPDLLAAGQAWLRFHALGEAPRDIPIRRVVPRPELPATAELPPGYSFHLLRSDLPPWTEARAELLLGEAVLPLGPAVLHPRPVRPRGHLSEATRWGIAGWLLDHPARPAVLLVDGRFPLPLPREIYRPDLPMDDGTDEPRLGFRLPLSRFGEMLRQMDPGASVMDGRPRALALLSGGVEIGRLTLRVPRRMEGALEVARPGEIAGWASEVETGGERPALDLLLDGTRWLTLPATTGRPDLLDAGIGRRIAGGACRGELPARNPGDAETLEVALRPAHGAALLPGATGLAGLPPWRSERGGILDTLPPGGLPPVAVVVPVHNAPEDLERCVEAVLRHTTGAARLILVDDASTDPGVAPLLARWAGLPGIEVHRNEANLGFAGTVNRGVALAGRDDVVLLNADTVVGPGWLDGLRLAAHASPRIGTVTPVSNNAGAFSVPEFDSENRPPEWFGPEDLARLARQATLSLWPEVPTGNGFCLYVRRACLDAVGPFDAEAFPRGYGEENDFCMRAAAAGFAHVLDDRTLVWHRRSASFGETRHPHIQAGRAVLEARYPEYGTLVRSFREDQAFLAIRWRMRRALERSMAAGSRPLPRVLFVLSTRSGGTPQTNADLMAALADRYEPWVLHSDGRTLSLARIEAGAELEAERHGLDAPLRPGSHRSGEYDRRVADMLLRHGIELVHIRHLAWHGLGLPEVCRALGIPVVLSFHDFYAVCPTVKLLDGAGRHCGGDCAQGSGTCVPELWEPGSMPPLRDRFVHRWRAMMGTTIAACDAFVTTSPHAAGLLARHLPELQARGIRLVPHGRSFAELAALAAEPTLEEPLRVLVPGNISAAKGGALIAAIAALDAERDIEFHVLGAVDGTLRVKQPGIVLHGRYARDAFAAHVREIRPHLAAILSVWPETYCHTLSECWSAGLPVLGTDLGAVAERIGASGGGWIVPHDEAPAAILALLQRLKRDPAGLRARREEVRAWQDGIGRHYDAPAMAVAYDLLYRELLGARRSFMQAAPAMQPPVVLAVDRRRPRGLLLPRRAGRPGEVIYRSVAADHPFGEPATGAGEAVLLPAGVLRPRDMPALLARVARAGLPAFVELDEALAPALADPALLDALRRPGVHLMAATPDAAALARAAGLDVAEVALPLDAADWLSALPTEAQVAEPDTPMGVLAIPGERPEPWFEAVLEQIAALGLATVHRLEEAASIPAFRGLAARCRLALLPGAPGSGLRAQQLDAAAVSGLAVLRGLGAGEAEGEAEGVLRLGDEAGWIRAIAELSVDAARCGRMAAQARQAALARLQGGGVATALDAWIARRLLAIGAA